MDFCTQCGGRIRPLFNMIACPNGCRKSVAPPFPLFWSRYCGAAPLYLPASRGTTPEDRVRVSDVVLLLSVPPPTFTGFFGAAVYADPGPTGRVVHCAKNLTWDRTVGKSFPVTYAEWVELRNHVEPAPERLQKDWSLDQMVCLKRSS